MNPSGILAASARRVRAYPGPVRAVIFDWAGTTVDHGSLAPAQVFVQAFAEHGIEITTAQARQPMGMAKRDHIAAIVQMLEINQAWREKHGRGFSETDIDSIYHVFLPLQLASLPRHCEVIPGVVPTVEALKGRGIRIGSSTGYTQELMAVVQPRAAAAGFVPEAMVCATDFPQGRPAPWMCFENARRLNVYPMAAVVKVDDTIAGVEEGLHASCWSVGVTRTGNLIGLSLEEWAALPAAEQRSRLAAARTRLEEAGAHYVIESVAELLPVIDEIESRLRAGDKP